MTQRFKSELKYSELTDIDEEAGDLYDTVIISTPNTNSKKCRMKEMIEAWFYDLYFKWTDLKFTYDCMDNDAKIRLWFTSFVIFIFIIVFIYACFSD